MVSAMKAGLPRAEILKMEVGQVLDFIIADQNLQYEARQYQKEEAKRLEEEKKYGRWATTQRDFDLLRNM